MQILVSMRLHADKKDFASFGIGPKYDFILFYFLVSKSGLIKVTRNPTDSLHFPVADPGGGG